MIHRWREEPVTCDLFWLTVKQMQRIEPHFPLSNGIPSGGRQTGAECASGWSRCRLYRCIAQHYPRALRMLPPTSGVAYRDLNRSRVVRPSQFGAMP